MKALIHCQILDGADWIHDKALVLEDGVIIALCQPEDIPAAADVEDLGGRKLVPGFIDCQVNGGGGILFNDRQDVDALETVAAAHRHFGTTGFLPTLISDDFEKMAALADAVETARAQKFPGLLGVHYEGPYLNPERKGVHDAGKIRRFEDRFLEMISGRDLGKILVTLAPECVPAEAIQRLREAGALVSAGHTNATYDETKAALVAGVQGFTHLFNAMPPLLSREPGVVGAALEDRNSYCGIIVDGHHVHPATLKTAVAAKGASRMMLVTDAMPVVGTGLEEFILGGDVVSVTDGACRTSEGTLAGSCLDMATAVRNCVNLLDLPLTTAVRMAAETPAAFLGMDRKRGRLAKGYSADMVLIEKDCTVVRTWIAGNDSP